jgi:membrane-bound lytic murein transglycosylase MltF
MSKAIRNTYRISELEDLTNAFINTRQMRGNTDMWIDRVESQPANIQKRFWTMVDAKDAATHAARVAELLGA